MGKEESIWKACSSGGVRRRQLRVHVPENETQRIVVRSEGHMGPRNQENKRISGQHGCLDAQASASSSKPSEAIFSRERGMWGESKCRVEMVCHFMGGAQRPVSARHSS